ncbi:MAG: hypothetical protein D6B28_05795 [Gammaproteobacteria bacterium]|nr:MAG: hypothetical protein D6B28_05795 [Gammaproteobacteria bacterium]
MNNTQEQLRQAEQDIERLKRELEFARNESDRAIQEALEADQSQHRIEVESLKKKSDLNQLRAQAEEVAKRRKLEKENAQVKGELQAAKQELSRFQLEAEELKQQIIEQKEKTRLEAQEEIASIRMQAKEAWRHAEEETSRLDSELAQLKELLENEKQQKLQAERTISKLESAIHQTRVASNTGTDNFDKKHFDKLLKKAHLAIRSLQDKLKSTVEERDDYYRELLELREHIFEHNKQEQTGKSSPFSYQSRFKKDDNVVPLKPAPFNRNVDMPTAPSEPQQIDLNSPLFSDELSDELLMIEGDTSFEAHEEEHNKAPQKKKEETEQLSNETVSTEFDSEPVEQPQPQPASGLHGSTSGLDHDDQQGSGVAEIAKELLQEKESPYQIDRSMFSADKDERYQFDNEPKKSHKWVYILCITVILAIAAAGGYYWMLQNPSNSISNFIANISAPVKPISTEKYISQPSSKHAADRPEPAKPHTQATKPQAATKNYSASNKTNNKTQAAKSTAARPATIKKPTTQKAPIKPAVKPVSTKPAPTVTRQNTNKSELLLKQRLEAEQQIRAKAEAEFNKRLEEQFGDSLLR